MQNFSQQRMPSLNLNIPATQSAYSPAALTAALSASTNATGRTVYVGNLPATASVDELLNLVHFGPLESIRVLPEKSCVFLSFLDGATAAAFHADATIKKLALHGQELKIGWGKPSAVSAQVALAISQSNASRNVYLGGLDESMTEEQLRDDLSRFGLIDQVKIVRDKNIGFVHFLSISIATKVRESLRCVLGMANSVDKLRRSSALCRRSLRGQASVSIMARIGVHTFPSHSRLLLRLLKPPPHSRLLHSLLLPVCRNLGPTLHLRRTRPSHLPIRSKAWECRKGSTGLCISVTFIQRLRQKICATRSGVGCCRASGICRISILLYVSLTLTVVRGVYGIFYQFVTFVDPAAAFTFYQVASYQGLTLNNRRLKMGWGKNSGSLPPTLALAVHSGATRNVYIGNVEDFETFTEERLKKDFGEFGDIELINFLKEKSVHAFPPRVRVTFFPTLTFIYCPGTALSSTLQISPTRSRLSKE
jgi:RNA recognition motif-containing protein